MEQRGAEFARRYVEALASVLARLPFDQVGRAIALLERARAEHRTVFLAGNGGSAASSSHMANDLLKGSAGNGRAGLRAIALSDNVPLITALANDEDYTESFAGQLRVLADPGDVLVILTVSGNSPSILRLLETAREREIATIGLLGRDGGQAAGMVDVPIVVPSDGYGPVEDAHLVLNHIFVSFLGGTVQE